MPQKPYCIFGVNDMYFDDKDTVVFQKHDMRFIAKFGIEQATDMAMEFHNKCRLPFLMDTCQLASFLSVRESELFRYVKECDEMYRSFRLKKRTGGNRLINQPEDQLLWMQRRIARGILRYIPVSRYATAYHRGATLTKNASPHMGRRYLLKLDLTDFFHSVRITNVYGRVFEPYYPKQIGYFLSRLCCKDGRLTQGAPVSPAISNIVMRPFDESFGHWCKKHGLSYTRYCDDITVSGDQPLYCAYEKAAMWLSNMGFEINEKKTRFITNASRQTVTGLTVNEKVSVPSDYKRRLRQEVYYVGRFGIESAADYWNHPDPMKYCQSLMGKVCYVLSVEPDNEQFIKAKKTLSEQFQFAGRI